VTGLTCSEAGVRGLGVFVGAIAGVAAEDPFVHFTDFPTVTASHDEIITRVTNKMRATNTCMQTTLSGNQNTLFST
jgi:hypothetical protein